MALTAALTNPHSAASYIRDHPPTAVSAAKFLDHNIPLLLAQVGYRSEAARCLNLCHATRENLPLWELVVDTPHGDHGKTSLMLWASKGDVPRVRFLLGRGASVNAINNHGMTALMYASDSGAVDAANELVSRGAAVNAKRTEDEWTALHIASQVGHAVTVAALVAHGANVNARNKHGNTPLMFAADEGHVETVQELMRRGADVNAQADNGRTALMMAADSGQIGTVCELLTSPRIDLDIVRGIAGLARFDVAVGPNVQRHGAAATACTAGRGALRAVAPAASTRLPPEQIDGEGETALEQAHGHSAVIAVLEAAAGSRR